MLRISRKVLDHIRTVLRISGKGKGGRWCTGPYLDSAVCCDRCADITDKCECTGPYLDSVVCCDRCADITDECECTGPYLDSAVYCDRCADITDEM